MTKLSFKEKEKTQIKLQIINKHLNDIVENIEAMHILINPEDPLAPPILNPEHPFSVWLEKIINGTLKDAKKLQKETKKLQKQIKVKKDKKDKKIDRYDW